MFYSSQLRRRNLNGRLSPDSTIITTYCIRVYLLGQSRTYLSFQPPRFIQKVGPYDTVWGDHESLRNDGRNIP